MGKNGRRKMQDWTLTELWERFQIFNRAANKSPKTLEWCDTGISRYRQYLLEELDREPTLADVTHLSVRACIRQKPIGEPHSVFIKAQFTQPTI